MKLKKLGVIGAAMLAASVFAQPSHATMMNFDLSWTGGSNGYYAVGSFSYDDTAIGGDNLATLDELSSFVFQVFDGSNALSHQFDLGEMTASAVFQYETDTGHVRQSGDGFGAIFLTEADPASNPFFIGDNGCSNTNVYMLADQSCSTIVYDSQGGSVTATASAVPVPAPLALMAAGVAGLGILARRRKNTA